MSTPDAVDALLAAVADERGHPPLADAKLVQLHRGGPGFTLLEEDGGRLVGVAVGVQPDPGAPVWNVQEAVAGPAGARRSLAARAVEEAWQRGAARVQWWAVLAGPGDDALAAELGLAPWREVVQMHRALPHPDPVELPEGVTLRAFVPGEDDAEWLAVNRRAFADHPEQATFDEGELAGRMAEPWFDPADFLVAEDASGMVGFCWVKVPDPGHGEIYVIGVDPRGRGSGLGRALTLAGMARMAEKAVPEARLYVDAGNEAGLALYEGLGFARHHVDRAYAGERS